MTLTLEQKENIEATIKNSIRTKLKRYKRESQHMPFHYRLIGKDRMALFSFIQSLNTTFGTSIFEPVALDLAHKRYAKVEKQYVVGNQISEAAQQEIQLIMNELSMEVAPNKIAEVERIRKVCQQGTIRKLKTVKVDLFLQDFDNDIHLFDLKTAKPNISNFKNYKRTLLEWIAILLYKNPTVNVHSYIAIPYNPYAPKPYKRWTLKGMLDLKQELKVAEEFWNFLGGENCYEELLDCFENAGLSLRAELDLSLIHI